MKKFFAVVSFYAADSENFIVESEEFWGALGKVMDKIKDREYQVTKLILEEQS